MKLIPNKAIKKWIYDNWKECLLYFLMVCISFFLFSLKEDFFLDELLTYNLANVHDLFEPAEGVTYSPASQPFVDAMASNGTFDLGHVWFQQAHDTHPPLYYILVHAISTLHPGSVSIRYAGIVNVIFMLFTFWAFRKIVKITVKDKTAVFLTSVMFVFSSGLLSMITLLRMYVMSLFWITLFTYLVIRHIEKYQIKDFIYLGLVAAAGALTHYYCIAYDFFISVCVFVICVFGKRFKEIAIYTGSMILAGGVSLFIFPAMITHIFNDERGTESFANLAESDFVSRVSSFFEMLSHEIFGGLLAITICVVIFLLIALFTDNEKSKEETNVSHATIGIYACLIIPSTCYFLLVAKSAPFFTERYISPIFAVTLAAVLSVLYSVIKRVLIDTKKVRIIFAFMIAIVVFLGFKDYEWPYLYRERTTALNNAEIYGGSSANAICIYDQKWKINPDYLEISKCGTATFYKVSDYDTYNAVANEELYGEKLAFFIIGADGDEFISRFINDHNEYVLACDNGEWEYGHSYYLRKD